MPICKKCKKEMGGWDAIWQRNNPSSCQCWNDGITIVFSRGFSTWEHYNNMKNILTERFPLNPHTKKWVNDGRSFETLYIRVTKNEALKYANEANRKHKSYDFSIPVVRFEIHDNGFSYSIEAFLDYME